MNGVPLDNEGIKTKANNNTNKNNDYKTQPESSKPKLWKIEEDHLAEEKQTEPTTSDFPADQLQCQKRRRSTITLAGTALSTYKALHAGRTKQDYPTIPKKTKLVTDIKAPSVLFSTSANQYTYTSQGLYLYWDTAHKRRLRVEGFNLAGVSHSL